MTTRCPLCGKEANIAGQETAGHITRGICPACVQGAGNAAGTVLLEAIAAPILLMQGNPRQVVTANRQALALFGKELSEVEGHRGGEVFDYVLSFTEAGCGKDVNCEGCPIKDAIVDTFTSGHPHQGVAATLQVKKTGSSEHRLLQVSTEKVGELALVRIERYDRTDQR